LEQESSKSWETQSEPSGNEIIAKKISKTGMIINCTDDIGS
jgi:hypothetical protein